MTYPQILQYLTSFVNYERIPAYNYQESLKLERISGFLELVAHPQAGLRCIHVAGTKGKGSTCAFVAYILREAGYRVGLYTSPHLSDFRERIRVLRPAPRQSGDDFEGMISEHSLVRLVEKIKPAIERFNASSIYGPLTFFEVYTVLAFIYFQEEKVDFAVLETGMGGRLDATNVVRPLVAALTPISYEHTQKLGNTLREIAAEKAGIIKGGAVVMAPQEKEAEDVVREKCARAAATLCAIGKDIKYKQVKDSLKIKGMLGEYADLKIALLGKHQLVNAAVSLGIIEALVVLGVKVDLSAIRKGFFNTRWPARCEIISKDPKIILDGAQNVASAQAIRETVKERSSYQRLILVFGISNDKDVKGVCNELKDLADVVILTQADNPRAVPAQTLAGYFKEKNVHLTKSVKEARVLAHRLADRGSLTLVCGSLFVAGEFRDARI